MPFVFAFSVSLALSIAMPSPLSTTQDNSSTSSKCFLMWLCVPSSPWIIKFNLSDSCVRYRYCYYSHFRDEGNSNLFSVTLPLGNGHRIVTQAEWQHGVGVLLWNCELELTTVLSWKFTTHIFGVCSLWFNCWQFIPWVSG